MISVAVAAVFLAACSAQKSPRAESSFEIVAVDVDGVVRSIAIEQPGRGDDVKALVLVLGAASNDVLAQESAEFLSDAGYASLVLDDVEALTPEEVARIFDVVAENRGTPVPQALLGFGEAGPVAWKTLEADAEDIGMAFLVSCALPEGRVEFERLARTGIRAVFAESGEVYRSSYSRAHEAMREVPTPHDFLVYGNGVSDDYYDRDSPRFQEATWDATLQSMTEWFDIWGAGPSLSDEAHHH